MTRFLVTPSYTPVLLLKENKGHESGRSVNVFKSEAVSAAGQLNGDTA
jgi:hypothetical protein